MSNEEQEVNTSEQYEEQPVDETAADSAELAELEKQVAEWEEESKKLNELQDKGEAAVKSDTDAAAAAAAEIDSRSIYVGNVDYSTTIEELTELFSSCGKVNRVTIPADKFTGSPKGFAYIEFENADGVASALILNETEFKGRPLKITSKRTNVPWFKQPGARGRGGARGGRGGFRGGRGGFMPVPMPYGFAPMPYPMYYAHPRGGAARGGRGGARGSRGRHQPY